MWLWKNLRHFVWTVTSDGTDLFFVSPEVFGHRVCHDEISEGFHEQNEPDTTEQVEDVHSDIVLEELHKNSAESISGCSILNNVEVICAGSLCHFEVHFPQRINDASERWTNKWIMNVMTMIQHLTAHRLWFSFGRNNILFLIPLTG